MGEINQEFIIQTLIKLVKIDSRNPSLCQDGPGEAALGAEIARLLDGIGLQVFTYPLAANRVNVVGLLPGAGGGPSLMLNGHMDTVGVEGMADPFSAAIRAGRLFGRGSQDMKGSLAAMLGAAKALAESPNRLRGDVIFAFVADEEDRSLGTMDLLKHHQAEAAIVTEPTDLALVLAHRGLFWYEVETMGKAVHGSRYTEGIDAIMRMGRFLSRLEVLERDLRGRAGHPLTGPPSLHAALIAGGTDSCTYADSCRLQIDRRSIPGERAQQVTFELQEIIDQLEADDPTFQAALRLAVQRPALETDRDSEISRAVQRAAQHVLEQEVVQTGAAYWSDAALLAEAGMEAVLFGPVGAGLHGPEEWVDLESVVQLAAVLVETAGSYCEIAEPGE